MHLCFAAEKKQRPLRREPPPPPLYIPPFLVRCRKFNEDRGKSPLAAAFPFLESTETCAFPLLRDSSRLQGVLQVCLLISCTAG